MIFKKIYRNILENMAYPVCVCDIDMNILYINPAAQKLLGWSLKEAIKMKYDEIFGDKSEKVKDIPVIERFHQSHYESKIKTKTGEEKEMKFSVSPLCDKGIIEGTIIILEDITEHKYSEKALRESEEKYRNYINNAPLEYCKDITDRRDLEQELIKAREFLYNIINAVADPIFVKDEQHRWIVLNDAFCKFMGYRRKELIGKSDYDFFPVEEAKVFWEKDELVFSSGIENENEEAFTDATGVTHIILTKKSIFTDKDGKKVLVGTIRDITDRKKAEEERARLEIHLRQSQKMEAIGTLAGGIAHDFNNILAIILGYAELTMRDIPEGSLTGRKIEGILKAGQRGRDLVRQILAFSRQGEKEWKPVRISMIVKETLNFLRASLPSTIEIRKKLQIGSYMIMADPTQIHQVLMNLCTNAAHAMKDKGGVLEVTLDQVELEADDVIDHPDLSPGSYLRLSVKDTGHGMEKDIIERIFDPFFTTKKPGEGTGMGLAVVHGIVKNHKGGIIVSSEPLRGSVFQVFLPNMNSDEISKIMISTPIPIGKARILLVDDEEDIVYIEQEEMENLGYEVISCSDSVEALETFRSLPDAFDLVITDQTMPHMTGLELTGELLKLRPDIPIILCSGLNDILTPDKVENIGIRKLLMKPIGYRELAEVIHEVLGNR